MEQNKKLNILIDMMRREINIRDDNAPAAATGPYVEPTKEEIVKKTRKESEWSNFQREASKQLRDQGIKPNLKLVNDKANDLATTAGYVKKTKKKIIKESLDVKDEDTDTTVIVPY